MRFKVFATHVFARLPNLRYYSSHYSLRTQKGMEEMKKEVVVMHEEDSPNVSLSFKLQNNNYERMFNLNRSTQENLNTVLTRISSNIQKKIDKKRKKNEAASPVIPIDLKTVTGESVDKNMTCYESFVTKADHHYLNIGELIYKLKLNPPTVQTLELPDNIMAGFPVYPKKFKIVNGSQEESVFQWYKSDVKFRSDEEVKLLKKSNINWVKMFLGYNCFTENDDVGRLLKVVVTPRRAGVEGEEVEGEKVEGETSVLVSAGPGTCPFERRHQVTKEPAGHNCLRVISYNILADQYADSEFARTKLFANCPNYAIDMDYRKQLLLKEIIGYNGDLVCLQEVDEKVYLHDLQHALRSEGLEGIYNKKGGTVNEGVAVFYRINKLKLLSSQCFTLCQELQTNVMFAEIWEKIEGCETLKEKVINRFNILQVSVLESVENPDQLLVVGVTHLYFRPEADHIRLLQAGIGLQILQQMVALYQNKYPEKKVSLMFCGDFNSTPEFEVYRLMLAQMATFDDIDWTDKENEYVPGVNFSHDLELGSACGSPPYTNYVAGFQGCLDYIFYQTDVFTVKQVVELPSHEEVTEHVCLPSVIIPSDHLAIIADLEFRKK